MGFLFSSKLVFKTLDNFFLLILWMNSEDANNVFFDAETMF